MNLATVRYRGRQHAARVEGDVAGLLEAPDVGELLRTDPGLEEARTAAPAQRVSWDEVTPLAVVPRPAKIICVGLNYIGHIQEVGQSQPEYPTVFAKFARALIGHRADILLPSLSSKVDWEVELVIVMGRELRHANQDEAAQAIAGFTVGNDISARDLQNRTSQWLQGKTCEASTPVGPWLTTVDETGPEPAVPISCTVAGTLRQSSNTSDLLFKPPELVSYLSDIVALEPGDLIFTGTPAGVGQGLSPPVFLSEGQTVVSTIQGIGTLENTCRAEGHTAGALG